jgi:hypothetical protein
VFATRTIRKGSTIAEYLGERISQKEASRRYDDMAMDRHHTFLFEIDDDICIDGAVGGNDSRFINHSCEPNAEAIQEGVRVFVVALRTIPAGEEITYDYRYIVEGPVDAEMLRLYACKCGTASCRGTIVRPELIPGKKPAAKKQTAKRASTKRVTTNRVTPKRAATKGASTKRSTKKRSTTKRAATKPAERSR